MGKHPTVHHSQAKMNTAMRPGLYGGRQKQSILATQTQATNFKIGDYLDTNVQYATTYNSVTGAVPARGGGMQRQNIADLPATKTSINLGRGHQNTYQTVN